METEQQIRDIKKRLRLFMNGPASSSMREKGLEYKMNFGIELPRIKEVADEFDMNRDLASALWKDSVRECRIMAGLLMPPEEFEEDLCDVWIEQIDNQEIAQHTCMNLFRHLPYARKKAFEWMASDGELRRLCGFTLMARLFMSDEKLDERSEAEFLDQAVTALEGSELLPRQSALSSIRKFAEQNRGNSKKVVRALYPLLNSEKEELKAIAQNIKSEIDYWR